MLNNVTKIEELKAEAIKIQNGETVIEHWPQFSQNKEQTFNPAQDHCVKEHSYTVNNSVIAFYEGGVLYVIPYFKKAIELLQQDEFSEGDMYVPFSHREYPLSEKEHWQALVAEARKTLLEEYTAECIAFSKSFLKVSPIDQQIIDERCLLIPEEGIEIFTSQNRQIRRFPVIIGYCCDCLTMDYLARYGVEKGIITFVNADGKQYVTKNQEMLDILIDSGYKYWEMPVILGKDEEPAQFDIAKRWNSL